MASAVVQEEQDVKAEMSFAPMIDVVFQLLIFFLVCSKIKQTEEMMAVYLPTDQGPERQPHPPIPEHAEIFVLVRDSDAERTSTVPLVKYSRGATYFINSTDGVAYTDLNQLRDALRGLYRNPEDQLIIFPADERSHQDQKTPWKNVLGVVDAGMWAGFRKIQFRPPRGYWLEPGSKMGNVGVWMGGRG